MLISVDPGVRGCGVAAFDGQLFGSRLMSAAYVRNPIKWGQDCKSAREMARSVFLWITEAVRKGGQTTIDLAIECPVVYSAAFQKGDQNKSIVPLTLVVGAVAACYPFRDLTTYAPRDWKGTADADLVCIPLIKDRLTEIEHTRVQLPSAEDLAHNVWDGIGVGLKLLGRLEPRRVFAKEP